MLRPWLQLAITFVVALSLVAAPCKNCQPTSQPQSDGCGHDCCPKPKPVQSKPCGWQPAAFDAVEAKSDITIDAPAVLPGLVTAELPIVELTQPLIPSIAPSPGPPPITVLRI